MFVYARLPSNRIESCAKAQGYAPTITVLSLSAKLPSLPISQSYVLVSGVIAL